MQTFFQTLRTWCAKGGTTFVCAETAMRVLLAACFAAALLLLCRRAQNRRRARLFAALGIVVYAALLLAPLFVGAALDDALLLLRFPGSLYAAGAFFCLLAAYLRLTRPCKTRRFLSCRSGLVAGALAGAGTLHLASYLLFRRETADRYKVFFFNDTPSLSRLSVTPGAVFLALVSLAALALLTRELRWRES